jgi:hypothetical protein
MLEEFVREQRTLTPSRLISLPRKNLDALLVERGISLDDLDDVKAAIAGVGVVISPEDAIKFTFNRTDIVAQRYNTSAFPVFYSALDHETCLAEIKYHLEAWIAQSAPRYYQFLEVTFRGIALELCGHQTNHPEIISSTEIGYPFCQTLASRARTDGIDALSAPSARHTGVCLPIFYESAISQPVLANRLRFVFNGTTIEHEVFEVGARAN